MKNYYIVSIGLLFSVLFSTKAISKAVSPSIFDQLSHQEVVDVVIETDLDELTADWRNDDKYRAVLSFKDSQNKKQFWNINLQRRGKFRRMHCSGIPPLKIFFDKDMLQQSGLAKYDDMKLVNYCYAENEEVAKELLLKEYLAYQLYAQLTEESFRVQLLRVVYKDVYTNKKIKQWAFLIEDAAEMRARIEAEKYELQEDIAANPFNEAQLQRVALFQYMIGNADWDPLMEKNVKMIEKDAQVLAVPYDFDFSGFVNPPYGKGNTRYNLSTMMERVYLGSTERLQTTIAFFQQKKSALYATIQDCELISDSSKSQLMDYLSSFYMHLTVEEVTAHQAAEIYSYGQ
jgi:hypothetical protein